EAWKHQNGSMAEGSMVSQSNLFSESHDIAAEFDQWAQSGRGDRMAAGHRFATLQLLENLAIAPDAVVLDAGCGIGWVLNDLLGERIAAGVGIDLSDEMIAIAATRCTLPHLSFAVADSANTGLESDRFSHIISIESLYYSPQPLDTLKEWGRLSKADGKLGLVIDLYQGNPAASHWVEALPLTVHNLSALGWQERLLSAGWSNVSYQQIPLPLQIEEEEFNVSSYFPSYEIYQAYCQAGSLLITAQKSRSS
ncbi:MAG: class I SAM-dependent methyltransferase, partial [Cyanobacteria bacterium P01_H01_bin.130]